MGKILGTAIVPHPPILLEEIGKGEEKKAAKTIEGLETISKYIKEKSPDTIILITPHGPLFRDAVAISMEERLEGDFGNFGQADIKLEFDNNIELIQKIINKSHEEDIVIAEVDEHFARVYDMDTRLDHGALVPLYFVDKEYKDFKLIHITYGLLPPKELYKFGRAIDLAIKDSNDSVMIIASGDLSHKLSNDGPYSYSPRAKEFDDKIVEVIRSGKMEDIIGFDLELAEAAGECGLRSFMIMAGIIGNYSLKPEILSYEGPFGVGYSTAKIDIIEKAEHEGEKGSESKKDLLDIIEEREKSKLDKIRARESLYVKLARNSLEYYIREGEFIGIGEDFPEEFTEERKAVFVTLKKDGILRGCIGSTEPTEDSVALEIIRNAISAGTRDPRFDPVEEKELNSLVYSVDLLSPPEPVNTIEELDVDRYGVIVTKGYKKGLLLPMLEGVDSVEEQISIALDKAGIGEDEDYTIERFEVIRYN